MLTALVLLLQPTVADRHRLVWEVQEDGFVTTYRRIGGISIAARCRPGREPKCVVASETVPRHISLRRLEMEKLPSFTIGLLGGGAGYGCEWIDATRSVREVIDSGQSDIPPIAEKFSRAGDATWDRAAVQQRGGQWFSCVATLTVLRRVGINMTSPALLPVP